MQQIPRHTDFKFNYKKNYYGNKNRWTVFCENIKTGLKGTLTTSDDTLIHDAFLCIVKNQCDYYDTVGEAKQAIINKIYE